MKFDTEYELQEFRNIQSEYFDQEGKIYPNVGTRYVCNRMLKLINSLESELKTHVVLADVSDTIEEPREEEDDDSFFAFHGTCEGE